MNESKPLHMQIRLDAQPDAVFRALTSAEALHAWLAEAADVDLPGGRWLFWGKHTPHNPAQNDGHMRLVDYQQNRMLSFAWDIGDRPTRVTFRLRHDDGAAILSLIHQRTESASAETFSLEDYWFVHLENLRRYLDGKPADARVDFSQPMTGDIKHQLSIAVSAERVWAVLTGPHWMERWIANSSQFELRAGAEYDLGWGFDGIEVIEYEVEGFLTISWQEMDGSSTRVTFSLDARGGDTIVSLHHSGFAPDHPNNGIWIGWLNYLNWIRSVAEYGARWQPPAIPLADHPWAGIYPKSMHEAQASLMLSEFDQDQEL